MLGRFLRVQAVGGVGGAAAVYVPVMVVNRGLALVRVVAVGAVLGAGGVGEFGRYQEGLRLINWVVPVIMFGLADVAERYAAGFERRGELRGLVRRQALRLGMGGAGVALLLVAGAPLVGRWLYGAEGGGTTLVILAAVNMVVLAFYQWLAGVLRGMRAYGAAAGMEAGAAVGLLILSVLGAWWGSAAALLGAYAVSTAVPAAWYAGAVMRRLKGETKAGGAEAADAGNDGEAKLGWFGRWAMVRVVLVMTFAFVSVWGVKWLAGGGRAGDAAAGQYAMPYTMAEMLAYGAVTLWASGYGVFAKAWAHGQKRRARVGFLAVGKWGGAGLLAAACGAVVLRGVVAWVLPAYAGGIYELLPALLGMFLWYGMLGFLVAYGDLQERPWVGALLWAVAVVVQAGVIGWTRWTGAVSDGAVAEAAVVTASALGIGAAALLVGPMLLWRPARLTATAVPVGIVLLAGLVFFLPAWLVGMGVVVVTVVVVGFLWMSGLLVRARERRGWRRWRGSGQWSVVRAQAEKKLRG